MSRSGQPLAVLHSFPAALKRTETCSAPANEGRDRQKGGLAKLAFPLDGASTCAPRDQYGGFSLTDKAAITCAGAESVARVAGWDEIVGPVVGCIPVEVVGTQGIAPRATSWHPVDLFPAPMTRMRSRADSLIEIESCNRHNSASSGKRMVWHFASTVLDSISSCTSALCFVKAVATAVAAGLIAPALEDRSAGSASMLHRPSILAGR